MDKQPTNPFRFGALALGSAFTDRQPELRELAAELRNGQDVLVYAPRRYGKSSLVLRAAGRAEREGALVGYVDLLKITSKERFAAALARTIHRDLDTAPGRAYERAAELFRGLRIVPSMEVDPQDGSLSFSFRATRRRTDIDDTIESLLELLGRIAAERRRRVVMIFDAGLRFVGEFGYRGSRLAAYHSRKAEGERPEQRIQRRKTEREMRI